MNRIGTILVMLLFAYPAFARQAGPRDLAGQNTPVEQPQQQLQLERSVVQLYLSYVRNEVGLTDEQFLRAEPVIRQMIRQRWENAAQRIAVNERQEQLLSQHNASDADFQKLNEEATRLDGEISTWDARMFRRLQVANTNLSDRQLSALSRFNRKFFEKLPTVVEQARANARGAKGPQQGPGAAGRANQPNRKDPAGQQPNIDALRGRDAQPVPPPRQKSTR